MLFRKVRKTAADEMNDLDREYGERLQKGLAGLAGAVYGAEPREILERVLRKACVFYNADCGGLLTLGIEREIKVLVPVWWFSREADGMSNSAFMRNGARGNIARWTDALKTNTPIYVEDVEKIRRTYPEEYAVYVEREIRSVLAVPYRMRETGFLLLENPRQYGDKPEMLQIMANLLAPELGKQKPDVRPNIARERGEIIVNLFGGLEIITSRGVLNEAEIKSPLACKMFVLLLLNRNRCMTGRELAERLWSDTDCADPTAKVRTLVCRFRTTFRPLSDKELIVTSSNGYRINRELSIRTDYEDFEKACEVSKRAHDRDRKEELLTEALKLYRCRIFPTGSGEHWLLARDAAFHFQYLEIVEELMSLLDADKNYSMMREYATMAVNVEPDSPTVLYWLIVSLRKHGAADMARVHLESAKKRLLDEEYKELEKRLIAV